MSARWDWLRLCVLIVILATAIAMMISGYEPPARAPRWSLEGVINTSVGSALTLFVLWPLYRRFGVRDD